MQNKCAEINCSHKPVKTSTLISKYDKIGIIYNRTRKADKYISDRLAYHLNLEKEKQYLDLGCGTGNYTIDLFKKGIRIMGIDPSEAMILNAKSKSSQIDWIIGTAEKTGLKDDSIDGIICCLTIHHWTDLNIAFRETNRILRKSGRLVIFTSTPEQMDGYWLNHYFPKMLSDSKKQMPTYEIVINELKTSGFNNLKTEKYFVSNDLQDCFLYCGKQRPELYLKHEIRQGISSFADLADKNEIENGLNELARDIASGRIQAIINDYKNENGDYSFFIGTKASG